MNIGICERVVCPPDPCSPTFAKHLLASSGDTGSMLQCLGQNTSEHKLHKLLVSSLKLFKIHDGCKRVSINATASSEIFLNFGKSSRPLRFKNKMTNNLVKKSFVG